MTLATSQSRVVYAGNGSTTSFPFAFEIPSQGDEVVIYTNAQGVATVLPNTQYSVSGFGSPTGGAVSYPLNGSPIANGTTLTIERIVPLVQGTSFENQGPYLPSATEGAFDYEMMAIQQLDDAIGRAIIAPPDEEGVNYTLPSIATRAYGILGFDGAGDVIIASYYPPGSQAVTFLVLQSTELWLKRDFLAKGDGSTDDTTAINQWVAAGLQTGLRLRAEPGVYVMTGDQWLIDISQITSATWTFPQNTHGQSQTGFWLEGSGVDATIFDVSQCTDAVTQFLFTDTNAYSGAQDGFFIYLLGIRIYGNAPGRRAATLGPDESPPGGFNFPHALNGVVLDICVVNAATASGSVGLRLNQLVSCLFLGLEVNGPAPLTSTPGPTVGIEFVGVTMTTGRILVGGFNIGVHYLYAFSFGNAFWGCDLEILQTVFQFDSAFGGAGDIWHGQMVWGALTNNILTTCQDGTTTFAICNAIDSFISMSGNIASAAVPILTGADASQLIIEKGYGQFVTFQNRPIIVQAVDGTGATLELISGTGSDSSTISQASNTLFLTNAAGGISLSTPSNASPIVLDGIPTFSDGTTQKHGNPLSHIAQPGAPASGTRYTNTNTFAVEVMLWITTGASVTNVAITDTVTPTPNTLNVNNQVGNPPAFILAPGWSFVATYSGGSGIGMLLIPRQ
jgi:hypothetical protein